MSSWLLFGILPLSGNLTYLFWSVLKIVMHLLNRQCQYKTYKDDKSNFVFKRILFAKFTQAHAAFGRGICDLL